MPDLQIDLSPTFESSGEPRLLTTRERKQADKRERIKLAARSLFAQHGYDRTTLRQIADHAGVGLGTIMLYADDKRDLVLLMYNDEVASLITAATNRISSDSNVVENISRFCQIFYFAFGQNISLARTYLQLNFYSEGANTPGLHQNRSRKLNALRTIIEIGQRRGEVRLDAPVDTMATAALLLYRASVRSWIAEPQPDAAQGAADLRELMELQFHGLAAESNVGIGKPTRSRRARMSALRQYAVST